MHLCYLYFRSSIVGPLILCLALSRKVYRGFQEMNVAFVVADAPAFALGIQWHPEWQVHASEESTAIFRAFGEACRKYRAQHH